MKDDGTIYNWFREVIRVRNEYPALARGAAENAPSLSACGIWFLSRSGRCFLWS